MCSGTSGARASAHLFNGTGSTPSNQSWHAHGKMSPYACHIELLCCGPSPEASGVCQLEFGRSPLGCCCRLRATASRLMPVKRGQ